MEMIPSFVVIMEIFTFESSIFSRL